MTKLITRLMVLFYAVIITAEYEYKTPSRDGIGKVYFGREISHVMGHLGSSWLERESRVIEERTDLLIQNLPLEPDFTVADIGAGTGYFSFGIANRVPTGEVLAIDIQDEMLATINRKALKTKVNNVRTIKGSFDSINLESNSVEIILIVDAYHEFSHPLEMGLSIREALKPGGLLILVEYRLEDPKILIKRLHKMSQEQIITEIEYLGLVFKKNENYLPKQHVMIFQKNT